jgi:3-oxoacyl-[acyl-carrier protein] reductase
MTDHRRVALVTGAAQGIGAAIALRLAVDGHAVALLDLHEDVAAGTARAIREATGVPTIAVGADVTNPSDVDTAYREIHAELGAPDILVNNAGITRDNLLFRMTDEDWDAVIGVHLRGAFLLSRIVHSHMREAGWGRIVNLSSTSAAGNRGQANYSAAKAGIIGLTRTLSKELGRFGITANAVAPGFIDTEMLRATATRLNVPFEEFAEASYERIPARRLGTPADVAGAVSFLTSDDASYVTGEVLHVSGGFAE